MRARGLIGGVGIIEVGIPLRDANTSGDVEYVEFGLLANGQVHTFGILVDVAEATTPAEKAAAIKDAIEGSGVLGPRVDVQIAGHVLTISAKAPYEGLRKIRTQDKSRETRNRARISYPGTAESDAAPEPNAVAHVSMIGAVPQTTGYVVEVGTDRWIGTWDPSEFASVAAVMTSIQSDLVANGINAVLENPWSLKLVVHPTLDSQLHWGNSAPYIEL